MAALATSRRGFLGGLLAVVSAPAIVRVGSLMALPAPARIIVPEITLATSGHGLVVGDLLTIAGENRLFSITAIIREAVKLWEQSNAFVEHIDRQYDREFAADQARIGSKLRIRLPNEALA